MSHYFDYEFKAPATTPIEELKSFLNEFGSRALELGFTNAATEMMKGINTNTVVNRTQTRHGLFDGLVGLS